MFKEAAHRIPAFSAEISAYSQADRYLLDRHRAWQNFQDRLKHLLQDETYSAITEKQRLSTIQERLVGDIAQFWFNKMLTAGGLTIATVWERGNKKFYSPNIATDAERRLDALVYENRPLAEWSVDVEPLLRLAGMTEYGTQRRWLLGRLHRETSNIIFPREYKSFPEMLADAIQVDHSRIEKEMAEASAALRTLARPTPSVPTPSRSSNRTPHPHTSNARATQLAGPAPPPDPGFPSPPDPLSKDQVETLRRNGCIRCRTVKHKYTDPACWFNRRIAIANSLNTSPDASINRISTS
eukprot:jgi/Hompol1/4136/HPOL_006940-RA